MGFGGLTEVASSGACQKTVELYLSGCLGFPKIVLREGTKVGHGWWALMNVCVMGEILQKMSRSIRKLFRLSLLAHCLTEQALQQKQHVVLIKRKRQSV